MGAKILLVEETKRPLEPSERSTWSAIAMLSSLLSRFSPILLLFLVCFSGPRGKQILG